MGPDNDYTVMFGPGESQKSIGINIEPVEEDSVQ